MLRQGIEPCTSAVSRQRSAGELTERDARGENRTPDILRVKQALLPLNYAGKNKTAATLWPLFQSSYGDRRLN